MLDCYRLKAKKWSKSKSRPEAVGPCWSATALRQSPTEVLLYWFFDFPRVGSHSIQNKEAVLVSKYLILGIFYGLYNVPSRQVKFTVRILPEAMVR